MPDDSLIGSSDAEIARIMRALRRDVEGLDELRRRIGDVRGKGEAAGGKVVAEALPTGELTGLSIDPRAMRLDSGELARAVLEAAANASKAAKDRVGEVIAPVISDAAREMLRAPTAGDGEGPR